MTPQKRTHHLPEEEASTEETRDETGSSAASDEPAAEDRMTSGGLPADDQAGESIPSFQTADSTGDPDFTFPVVEDDQRDFEEFPMHPIDEEPIRPAAARRRRRPNRLLTRPDVSELGERLESMARRSVPTFDFFFFSLLAGAIIGFGFILDQPAILLFGVLTAPILAPWVGAALAAATGEIRFLGQTIGGFFTALFMVFITGILAGLASRIWMPITTEQALLHAHLWIPDLLLLAIGTVVLTIALIQKEEKPVLASLMVAYEIYLPVSAAGFGLGNGVPGLWPQAVWVLLIHLAISMVLALIVFYYMGFRPIEAGGYAMAGSVVIVGVALAGAVGWFTMNSVRGDRASPTAPAITAGTPAGSSVGAASSSASSSASAFAFTAVPTVASTPTYDPDTATPGVTSSPTSLPTPVYGHIKSSGGGVIIRVDPSGATITSVQDGYLVEILPDPPVTEAGAVWVRILVKTASRDIVGWVQLNLIDTTMHASPATPTVTTTPTIKPASP